MAAQTNASLQSSCTVLATNPRHPTPPSSKPFSAKPSHFLTQERHSHRFQVSCNGGANHKPPAEGRVDRRNMLLGLGGLYGAANLISDPQAFAGPIQAPEFTACGKATASPGGDLLDVNCCPPTSDNIIDYQLPQVTKLRVRPAAHKVCSWAWASVPYNQPARYKLGFAINFKPWNLG
ncbi:hypothetical protein Pfo_014216 [Paulownia fortunei]|nr:hypothetical protein Pfo_014216 [Paulownia fortunei]